jgi:CBS domain-containing protein
MSPSTARTDHGTVAEVMTREVVTVTPEATYKEMARLLTRNRISAVPVVDPDGRLLGVVAEEDLLPKERRLEKPPLGDLLHSWREEHRRAQARVAAELMTAPAVAVGGETTLQDASRLMHRRRLRRLCVVDAAGALTGIVTQGDLLRVFARPDEDIRDEIRQDLVASVMWLDPDAVRLRVEEGVVQLQGTVERHSDARILSALAERVEGVVAVEEQLSWRFEDAGPPVIPASRF